MVDMKLELIPLPVADVDRARTFYAEQMGFTLDVDREVAPGVYIVQATPPASGCSVMFGTGLPLFTEVPPGSVRGVHLVVRDIEEARAELVGRGVPVGPVEDVGGGVKYAQISDPDGNTLALQEMAWRTGEAF